MDTYSRSARARRMGLLLYQGRTACIRGTIALRARCTRSPRPREARRRYAVRGVRARRERCTHRPSAGCAFTACLGKPLQGRRSILDYVPLRLLRPLSNMGALSRTCCACAVRVRRRSHDPRRGLVRGAHHHLRFSPTIPGETPCLPPDCRFNAGWSAVCRRGSISINPFVVLEGFFLSVLGIAVVVSECGWPATRCRTIH